MTAKVVVGGDGDARYLRPWRRLRPSSPLIPH
jgi:hypothetical protein